MFDWLKKFLGLAEEPREAVLLHDWLDQTFIKRYVKWTQYGGLVVEWFLDEYVKLLPDGSVEGKGYIDTWEPLFDPRGSLKEYRKNA